MFSRSAPGEQERAFLVGCGFEQMHRAPDADAPRRILSPRRSYAMREIALLAFAGSFESLAPLVW